jgi:hypothetical protein
MRKGIKLKAIFTDEEKSLKRFRNYEIEDLGQDGTVYIRNDNNFVLTFTPNEVRNFFNIEKNDRRMLVGEMLCKGYHTYEIAIILKVSTQIISRDISILKEMYEARNIWELTHKFTIEELITIE